MPYTHVPVLENGNRRNKKIQDPDVMWQHTRTGKP